MKFRIISGLVVISLFGIVKSGAVLVDPGLKDVQQFLKGDFVADNPALSHLPTAGPNYIAQTTTFVGQPIVVQNDVKLIERSPSAQSPPTADYGPVDKSDVSLSYNTNKGPSKSSVTILKEFSLGYVPDEKGSHANIQYDVHQSPGPDAHVQHAPQNSYGVEDIGAPDISQGYKSSPPIQEFIDQHTQHSIGTSYAFKNQGQNNNQYNQDIQQGDNNGYGPPDQQSENLGYQNNQQQNGGYDQQSNGGYQQQQQSNGGYQEQQQAGGYQQDQQQQQIGGYQQDQQQQQIGGYQQDQQQQQIGGYQQQQAQQQQQQIGGYQQPQDQQQQVGGYQQQQSGGYQQQQQQSGGYQQQQQQSGGYDQAQVSGGYNIQPEVNQQQSAGGYNDQVSNQQQSSGGYDQNPSQNSQQPQNGGGYNQNSFQQQNSALFQKQENNNNGQGVIQQAQLQAHGQLLQQNSQQLVQALGFGPVLQQAELVFKSEAPEVLNQQPQGNSGQNTQNSNQYGVPNQSQTPNSQYGAPQQSQTPISQYGAPQQSQTPNTQYGAPQQSQNSNAQYGAPQQSKTPNSQYGAPQQSQNSNAQYGVPEPLQNAKSPMDGWNPIKPQFARSHYAKGGDQGSWTPKVAQATSLSQGGYSNNVNSGQGGYSNNANSAQGGYSDNKNSAQGGYSDNVNSAQGGYSDNVNLATKGFRVNNLVVDKSGVLQSYNSDKAAKVVIHAQNVIIKSDIPVEKANLYKNGNSRDITPILKEQLRTLMNNRAQQQKDASITAKTNAFVAIPNYFKPSNKPLPLNNLKINGAVGTGGYAYQANSGYNLATSVQQASAYSNTNNVKNFPNYQAPAPLTQQIPNDYGAGLQAPLPYAAASNNVNVAAGPPSPPNDYNAGLSAPPIGSAASTSNNNYAPPPVPTAFSNPISQIRLTTKPPPKDYHAGLYAPPPTPSGGSSHIPEGKIVGPPVPLKSQSNGNGGPPRGKGPPRFKSGKPGSTRDYGSSVSYFGKGRPTKFRDSESQSSVENPEFTDDLSTIYGAAYEHPFAHLATKRPRNSTNPEKLRYGTKRPKLFSIHYGNEEKRPEKIVEGPAIDLQDFITSNSEAKNNYKYRGTSSKEIVKSPGSSYSIEFTDPYTRLGKDLFYSVYDMIKKNTPSFQTIASIPRAISSTMKGIKIPPVRLEFFRN